MHLHELRMHRLTRIGEIVQQYRWSKLEKQMLEFILGTLMLPNENFIAQVEEYFTNWDDDCEVINQLILYNK